MAWISRNNSTHALILAACQFLQAGVGAGSPAPRLGVDQSNSSGAEQLSDTEMGFAWKPLQHTLMTRTESVETPFSFLQVLSSLFDFKREFRMLTKPSAVKSQLVKIIKINYIMRAEHTFELR